MIVGWVLWWEEAERIWHGDINAALFGRQKFASPPKESPMFTRGGRRFHYRL